MKKIIREVDKKRGIVQVTIADERWYLKSIENATTGIPEFKAVPSLTWIAQSYPKGIGYYKWLAEHGWDEAETIKTQAGDKGSKVHEAIADIIQGKEVRIDSKYLNRTSEQLEELTLEECDAILSYKKWYADTEKEYIIEVITWENSMFSDKENFAGTVDFIVKLTHRETKEEVYWVIDFKTSQFIWASHEIQINGYKTMLVNGEHEIESLKDVKEFKMAILQVGYRKNKAGYKFTEIEDAPALLQASKVIWKNEHGNEQPTKKDYPIILSPALVAEQVIEKKNEE